MHRHDAESARLTEAVIAYALERIAMDPPPLDQPVEPAELAARVGETITSSGLGGQAALAIFAEHLAPTCISVDHPRHLSFVPGAPTESSILFDLVVGASNIYAGSWLESAGAVYAENQALRWLADLAGLPTSAGGVFVSGGTAGNLSALIAARWAWRHRAGGAMDQTRGLMVASAGAHSSVTQAARAMDADVVMVPADECGRICRAALDTTLASLSDADEQRLFALVATCGTTNAGVIDELDAVADAAERLGVWMHVDGAYGGAGLAAPSVRDRYVGIERCDSLIIDPHKWLFAPYDSCGLLYRDPFVARAAHTQHAEYLDVLHADDPSLEPWNASDYAHHLSRRARGLPFWFSLATHGTDAYRDAVETTLDTARAAARLIDAAPHTELVMEPELSVVLFRRVGWTAEQYRSWSDRQLREQVAFVVPTMWSGETVGRFCIVNPVTAPEDLAAIIESMG
jgi:L-2,4-diaminobutyrate decarboxylase